MIRKPGLISSLILVVLKITTFSCTAANQNLHLTDQEIKWLQEHPVINVGIDKNWPPIEFIDDNNTYQGIASEFILNLSQQFDMNITLNKSLNW